MSKPLLTEDPPAHHPVLAGATWTRAANPRGVVTIDGVEVWQVFAANEQVGFAAAYVTDGQGRYVLDAPGRYRVRRLHGAIAVK